MKKLLSMLAIVLLSATLFTACTEEPVQEQDMTDESMESKESSDMGEESELAQDTEDEESKEAGEPEEDMDETVQGGALGVATDGDPFGDFTTTSVYGHEVTQDVFAEYDMTIINVWATWCPPCIGEMDELEEVYQELPENVNLLTICDDGSAETDLAIQILEENGCNFDALIVSNEMRSEFISTILAFPTTVFVDREGNIFGNKIEGAPQNAVEYYLQAAEEHMEMLAQ